MKKTSGRIEEVKLYSNELEEEMTLMVYTPANYSPLYKYNVLIAQDGKDYFTLGRIGSLTDELLANNEIQNTIIIGIPYKDVQDRRKKYHPEGTQQSAYIRFLAHELTPFIDREYPTYQMGMGRALIGDSLGATVSLMTALSYPHTFGKVIMQSPYVDESVLNKVKDFAQPSFLSLYHVIGTQETAVPTTDGKKKDFIEPNRALHSLMKEKDYSVFYEEFEGNHTWTYWQPDLRQALTKMFA
ncbi:alpha/beta hydrolase [Sutcliffiella halmapala]|uniref:alpha/beta hydrolase n=1 Tax=Sutcliffiella halmapala TaxID=79882 RepID=UPI000995A500|nr:esterase family protein [Sutcliffiella halmapala]